MDEDITTDSGLTIELDLGDKLTDGCVLSDAGEVIETSRVATTMTVMARTMNGFAASRVVLEVGTHSPWISRLVSKAGHESPGSVDALVHAPHRYCWHLDRKQPHPQWIGRFRFLADHALLTTLFLRASPFAG